MQDRFPVILNKQPVLDFLSGGAGPEQFPGLNAEHKTIGTARNKFFLSSFCIPYLHQFTGDAKAVDVVSARRQRNERSQENQCSHTERKLPETERQQHNNDGNERDGGR